MLLCYLKGLFWHWRTVAWTANAYVLLLLGLLFLIPESPAWLVSRGRSTEALKSLQWINKYRSNPKNLVSVSTEFVKNSS